ncbi:MAG: hypothetical protein JNN07_21740 [Verrucomicrobiales bacterium]|nr:hypothetical protein [Verrucomicrobiales bacterium]
MDRLREYLRGTYDQEALFYGVTIALYATELLAPFYYSLRHLSDHSTVKGYRHFWIVPACIGSLFLFDAIARDRLPGDNTFTYLALPSIHWLVGLYFFLLQHNGRNRPAKPSYVE